MSARLTHAWQCMPNCRRGAHDRRCGTLFPVELVSVTREPVVRKPPAKRSRRERVLTKSMRLARRLKGSA